MNFLAINNTKKMRKEQCAKWVPPVIGSNKIFERRADGRLWPCWFPETTVKFNRDTLSSCSSLQSFEYAAELKTDSPCSNAKQSPKGKLFQKVKKRVTSVIKENNSASPRNSPFTSGFLSSVSLQNTFSERNVNENFADQGDSKNHLQYLQNDPPAVTKEDIALRDGLESNSDKMSSASTINSKINELLNFETKSEQGQVDKMKPKCGVKTLYVRPQTKKSIRRSKTNFSNMKSTDTILSILPKMSFVDTDDGTGINIIEIPLDFSDGFTKHKADVPVSENRRISDAQFGLGPLFNSHNYLYRDDTEMYIDKNRPSSKKLIEEYKLTWGPPDKKDDTLLDISPIGSEFPSDHLHSPADSICVNEFVAKIDSITFRDKPTCSHSYVKSPIETTCENTQRNADISCKIRNLKVKKWDWDNINCADDIPAWFLNLIEGHYTKKYKEGKRRNPTI